MKDFEQLLQETLQDVREAEPRSGIEARVMARIVLKAKSDSHWPLLSGAIAAGLLVAVLFHGGTRRQIRQPVALSYVAATSANCLTPHETCPSAEGATHISLGQRPRNAPRINRTGLKARDRGAIYRPQARSVVAYGDGSPHSKLPRNASLRIDPIAIASLRIGPMELASLTPKNRNERGETQ